MSTQLDLPKPACRLGYTAKQLVEILGDRLEDFWDWMIGQTVGVCSGLEYDQEKGVNRKTDCGPHGTVVYTHDLRRFMADGGPLD